MTHIRNETLVRNWYRFSCPYREGQGVYVRADLIRAILTCDADTGCPVNAALYADLTDKTETILVKETPDEVAAIMSGTGLLTPEKD